MRTEQEDIIKFLRVLFPSVESDWWTDNRMIGKINNITYVRVDNLDEVYLSDIVEAAHETDIKCERISVCTMEGHLTFEIY